MGSSEPSSKLVFSDQQEEVHEESAPNEESHAAKADSVPTAADIVDPQHLAIESDSRDLEIVEWEAHYEEQLWSMDRDL